MQARPRLADFGLVAFDMDSTLITVETLDEIADLAGLKDQIAPITAAAMRGEIDFTVSLTRRLALFTGLDIALLQRVYDERVRLTPGAEHLIAELKRLGIKTLLVSGGFEFFTQRLQARLEMDYAACNRIEIVDGRLTGRLTGEILDAPGKAVWLEKIRLDLGLEREQVIAIGDGANDIPMLKSAGMGIAFNAKPLVRSQASYAVDEPRLDAVLGLFALTG